MRALACLAAAVLLASCATTNTAVQAPSASIEARLQRVEDELAIRRIINDYAAALDARDAEAYVALFARNGEWVNGSMVRRGPDEIRALVVGLFGATPMGFGNRESFELTSNPRIELDGDHATAHSFHLLIRRGPEGRPAPSLVGRYDDEFVREDGKWKILRRVDNPIMPTAEEWRAIMAARRAQQQQPPQQ